MKYVIEKEWTKEREEFHSIDRAIEKVKNNPYVFQHVVFVYEKRVLGWRLVEERVIR